MPIIWYRRGRFCDLIIFDIIYYPVDPLYLMHQKNGSIKTLSPRGDTPVIIKGHVTYMEDVESIVCAEGWAPKHTLISTCCTSWSKTVDDHTMI